MITQSKLISDFLESFDPDSLRDCLSVLNDDTRDQIRRIVEPSPQTEEAWESLRTAHRIAADALFAKSNHKRPKSSVDVRFIADYDWTWNHENQLHYGFQRYEVFALRTALGIPTHECDWSDWCERNADRILETGLNPWVFENRTRWYAYLQSGGMIPWTRYEDCPRPDNLLLNAERDATPPTVPKLLARLRLVDDNHPHYFFNIRLRLTERLYSLWGIRSYW